MLSRSQGLVGLSTIGSLAGKARAETLARYPRQGFGSEFLARFEDQAKRKPGSAAAASVANNAAGRIKANPLDG